MGSLMPSKNEQSGNQTTQNEIDPRLREYTERGMDIGDRLRTNVPRTPAYYGGDTVADLTGSQSSLLDRMIGRSGGSGTEAQFRNYVQGQMGQDLTGRGNAAWNNMSGMANAGSGGVSTLDQIARSGMGLGEASQYAMGGGQAQQALNQSLSGQVNPLTSQMFRQAAGDLGEQFQQSVMPGINQTFGGAGRTGSGAHTQAMGNAAGQLADAQSGLAAQMYGGASESALNRQQQALGQELGRRQLGASMYESGQGRRLGAGQSMLQGGLGATGQMGSLYGNMANNQLSAAGFAPTVSGMEWNNMQQGMNAANRYQQQNQAEINQDVSRYEHNAGRAIQDHARQLNAVQSTSGLGAPLMAAGRSNTAQAQSGKSGPLAGVFK